MNQTRLFLLFAWLMVATLLWMEWGREQQAALAPATPTPQVAPVPAMVPGQSPTTAAPAVPVAPVPAAPGQGPVSVPVAAAQGVIATTDVLKLALDGGGVSQADLLGYPQTRDTGSPPVRMFSPEPARFAAAQTGWVGQNGASAPSHQSGFVPAEPGKAYALAAGQDSLDIPFVWNGPDGVSIQRTYVLKRGSYVVEVRDVVRNAGSAPWSGYVYRQLVQVPQAIQANMFHPESYSFRGATWFSKEEGYERRRFDDYLDDGHLNRTIGNGWLAMLQHHFFTAWIPQADQPALYALDQQIGNWGWAIIGLVVLLKIALFPLSNAQYKSAAKMRRFQPRMQQLKERYGDDKQKFQQAMMELYKTEKINPVGGCLPIIPQILIFMTLYWVLSEAVELRHAPWIGWIQDLTARDPYFILPVLNAAIMIATQHLTPMAPGMDPMQQKMMKAMPIVFGVLLAFLPAGLVLYQVANGGLGLLQQWYMLRKYGDAPPKGSPVKPAAGKGDKK